MKAIPGLLISAVVCFFYFYPTENYSRYIPETERRQAKATEKSTRGNREDPNARFNFDQLRLGNPKTGKVPESAREENARFIREMNARLKSSRLSPQQVEMINQSFRYRGPFNVGGRTRALAIDKTREEVILAGGVSGGLWRSENSGKSWDRVTRKDQLPSVTTLLQDPREGKTHTWYYGTGEIVGNSATAPGALYRGDGILKSTDGGKTFSVIPSTRTGDVSTFDSNFKYVNNLAIDGSNNRQDEIYAATTGGIIRTTDGFNTWQQVLGQANEDARFTDVAVTATGEVYATISNLGEVEGSAADVGIFRSEDGINWTNITPPTGFNNTFFRTVIGIDPQNENRVYFLGNKSDNTNSLHRYNATDSTWTDLTNNIPRFGGPVGDFEAQGSYNLLVKVHPADSNIVFLGGTNLYRSTSAFRNSTQTRWIGGYNTLNDVSIYPGHHPDQHALVFYPSNPDKMLSGHDGGVSITENNRAIRVNYTSLNNGYLTTQFYALAIDELNLENELLLGGMQDNSTYAVFDSRSKDADWVNIFGGDGGFCAVSPTSIVVSSQFANMFRYGFEEESGALLDQQPVSPPSAGNGNEFLFITPFILDPVKTDRIFIGARGKIYFSDNVGRVNSGDDYATIQLPASAGNQRVSALGADQLSGSSLYAGTEAGQLFKIENRDADNPGVTNITGSNFPRGYINCISVDPNQPDHLFVVFSNYRVPSIFFSNDGGSNWQQVGGNLDEAIDNFSAGPSVNWLAQYTAQKNPVFLAGTSAGLFQTDSLEGNQTFWTPVAPDVIGNTVIDMIKIRQADGYVAVATHGNGIYDGFLGNSLQPQLRVSGNLDLCEGDSITFSATRGEDNLDYQWFRNGNPIPGAEEFKLTTTREGTYRVQIGAPQFRTDSKSDNITVTLIDEPDPVIYYDDDDNTLRVDEDCEACAFQWKNSRGNLTGFRSDAISRESIRDTVFAVEVSNQCFTVESKPFRTADINTFSKEDVVAYPNPTDGQVTVNLKNSLFASEIDVRILTAMGSELQQGAYKVEQLNKTAFRVNLGNTPAGLYLVRLRNGNSEVVKPIIKN